MSRRNTALQHASAGIRSDCCAEHSTARLAVVAQTAGQHADLRVVKELDRLPQDARKQLRAQVLQPAVAQVRRMRQLLRPCIRGL